MATSSGTQPTAAQKKAAAKKKATAEEKAAAKKAAANENSTDNPKAQKPDGDAGNMASVADGVTTITVTGPNKGRHRAGRTFGPEPTLIPVDELTEDDLAALKADPRLQVSEGDDAA